MPVSDEPHGQVGLVLGSFNLRLWDRRSRKTFGREFYCIRFWLTEWAFGESCLRFLWPDYYEKKGGETAGRVLSLELTLREIVVPLWFGIVRLRELNIYMKQICHYHKGRKLNLSACVGDVRPATGKGTAVEWSEPFQTSEIQPSTPFVREKKTPIGTGNAPKKYNFLQISSRSKKFELTGKTIAEDKT